MKNILLRGGRRLTGTLGIHGAKNAILPIYQPRFWLRSR